MLAEGKTVNIKENKFSATKIIAETVTLVALATVLSFIKIFEMPQGGSVTLASMVPILLLALRRGPKVGLAGAILYGVIQAMMDPYIVGLPQAFLDYPVAFGFLGVAGFFQKRFYIGVTLGIFGRFLAHFFSGIIFFLMYVPEGMNPLVYSAMYNGGYLLVEFVISIYIIFLMKRTNLLKIYM